MKLIFEYSVTFLKKEMVKYVLDHVHLCKYVNVFNESIFCEFRSCLMVLLIYAKTNNIRRAEGLLAIATTDRIVTV
jgi:hypothetical protein